MSGRNNETLGCKISFYLGRPLKSLLTIQEPFIDMLSCRPKLSIAGNRHLVPGLSFLARGAQGEGEVVVVP